MNIGQASAGSGVPAKMIRYYERIGLIASPHRSESGYRTYTTADLATLRFIRQARDLGFPLAAIRDLLTLWRDRSRSSRDVKQVALATIDELRMKRDELQRMIGALEHLAAHCHGDERPECPIIDSLSGSRTLRDRADPIPGDAAQSGNHDVRLASAAAPAGQVD